MGRRALNQIGYEGGLNSLKQVLASGCFNWEFPDVQFFKAFYYKMLLPVGTLYDRCVSTVNSNKQIIQYEIEHEMQRSKKGAIVKNEECCVCYSAAETVAEYGRLGNLSCCATAYYHSGCLAYWITQQY